MEDYTYDLPRDRIAQYPLPVRHDAALLVCQKNGIRKDRKFKQLKALLPENTLLVLNRSKVIPARLIFRKETGAFIEIFCLEPQTPAEYNLAFSEKTSCVWYCTIGNVKKWKAGKLELFNPEESPEIKNMRLQASLHGHEEDKYRVRFEWQGSIPFSAVLETAGNMPIPPYLRRFAEPSDTVRYQTVYARERGSVAAPTAGLHFTETLLSELENNGIQTAYLSLHVGAGTFRPVKTQDITGHTMHCEPFFVSLEFLRQLLRHEGPVVPVGTTSCRCLESLYYLGVQAAKGLDPVFVDQWAPYGSRPDLSYKEALGHLIGYLEEQGEAGWKATTQLIIIPGFSFRATDALITNFHQPGSTLLLLVAALVGSKWKEIYDHALAGNYRFLSYGDTCLLFNPKSKKIR
ncbi:MAG: S-adenosylmethionine:tRNA ribosyltransferase-isomerase [Bacteroidales bacterium]